MKKINNIRIAKSALTDNIYAGYINKDGISWRKKVDVTNDFLKAVIERWEESYQTITTPDGTKYKISVEKLENKKDPGVKVGVAVFIIKYENNIKKILFGKRKNTTTGEGCWQLPGGRMNKWEDPIDTGIRETKEETTLDIKNLKFIDFTNDIFNKEDEHWITLFYETKDFEGTPKVVEDKCSEWQWFSEDNFPSPLFLPTRKIWEKRKEI